MNKPLVHIGDTCDVVINVFILSFLFFLMFYEVICHCHCHCPMSMSLSNCMMTWNSIASKALHNYHILHLNVVCIVAKTTMNCHSNLKTYLQFPYLHEEIDELDAPK